jgi:histone H3/H4
MIPPAADPRCDAKLRRGRELSRTLGDLAVGADGGHGRNGAPEPMRRTAGWEETMAAAKKKKAARSGGELIISKSRTKAAAKKCNVGSEFYGALDAAVRGLIKNAEDRATGNKRKTLKAVDL